MWSCNILYVSYFYLQGAVWKQLEDSPVAKKKKTKQNNDDMNLQFKGKLPVLLESSELNIVSGWLLVSHHLFTDAKHTNKQ